MSKTLKGGCLCGQIEFTVMDDFETFYQCHCGQCRQITGSAFASNLWSEPGNIQWLKGTEGVEVFRHPERDFTKAFCTRCGSGVPYVNQSGEHLVVPAGSLFDQPSIELKAMVFTVEQVAWCCADDSVKSYSGFAE